MSKTIYHADCAKWLGRQPIDSVDMVFTSPPYEDARTYGIDFRLKGQAWVDWIAPIIKECVRVSRGSVFFVVEGKTKNFAYTGTPVLLMADLIRDGVTLRKPPIFRRNGIPGSGGRDSLRNDYEFIIWATSGGKLPWSDNVAMGQPPKYQAGGACSNRTVNGSRQNAGREKQKYAKPKKSNPGNVIHAQVGGGHMGSPLAHENEAPFPESLAEFFIRSFCPPSGIVLDPFCGSGTTLKVAMANGRRAVGVDVRESQVALSGKRILEGNPMKTRYGKIGGKIYDTRSGVSGEIVSPTRTGVWCLIDGRRVFIPSNFTVYHRRRFSPPSEVMRLAAANGLTPKQVEDCE